MLQVILCFANERIVMNLLFVECGAIHCIAAIPAAVERKLPSAD